MVLKIQPYKQISPIVKEKLSKGASIVELLTNYKTPCYVYQNGNDEFGLNMVATNVGVTLSNGNLTSFIFDTHQSNEIYIVKYISGINTILQTPNIAVQKNSGKQLTKSYFSEIKIDGNYQDILSEFENQGWKIFRPKLNPEDWKINSQILRELSEGHRINYDAIEKKALEFYNGIV